MHCIFFIFSFIFIVFHHVAAETVSQEQPFALSAQKGNWIEYVDALIVSAEEDTIVEDWALIHNRANLKDLFLNRTQLETRQHVVPKARRLNFHVGRFNAPISEVLFRSGPAFGSDSVFLESDGEPSWLHWRETNVSASALSFTQARKPQNFFNTLLAQRIAANMLRIFFLVMIIAPIFLLAAPLYCAFPIVVEMCIAFGKLLFAVYDESKLGKDHRKRKKVTHRVSWHFKQFKKQPVAAFTRYIVHCLLTVADSHILLSVFVHLRRNKTWLRITTKTILRTVLLLAFVQMSLMTSTLSGITQLSYNSVGEFFLSWPAKPESAQFMCEKHSTMCPLYNQTFSIYPGITYKEQLSYFDPQTFVKADYVSSSFPIQHSHVDGRVIHTCTYAQQMGDNRPLCTSVSMFDNIVVSKRPNWYPDWFAGYLGKIVMGTATSLLVKPFKTIFRFVVVVCLWRLFQHSYVLVVCGGCGLCCWIAGFVIVGLVQVQLSSLLINNFQVSIGSHVLSLILSIVQLFAMDFLVGFLLYFLLLQWRRMYVDLKLLHLLDNGTGESMEELEAQLLDSSGGSDSGDVAEDDLRSEATSGDIAIELEEEIDEADYELV